MKICSLCDNKVVAKGLCNSHYKSLMYDPKKAKEVYEKNKEKYNRKWTRWSRTIGGQYATSKNKSKNAGIIWDLTKEEYSELRSKNCDYCSGPLPETSLGLDRLVGPIGYVLGNVVPCCRNCNMLRGDMLTPEETKQLICLLRTIRSGKVW